MDLVAVIDCGLAIGLLKYCSGDLGPVAGVDVVDPVVDALGGLGVEVGDRAAGPGVDRLAFDDRGSHLGDVQQQSMRRSEVHERPWVGRQSGANLEGLVGSAVANRQMQVSSGASVGDLSAPADLATATR